MSRKRSKRRSSRRTSRRSARRGRDRTLLWLAAGGGLLWLAARGQAVQAAAPSTPIGVPSSGAIGSIWSSISGALSNILGAAGSAFQPFAPVPATSPAAGATVLSTAMNKAFPPGVVYPGPDGSGVGT